MSKNMQFAIVVGNKEAVWKYSSDAPEIRTFTLQMVRQYLQLNRCVPFVRVKFFCKFTLKGVQHVHPITADQTVKIPRKATDVEVFWKCSYSVVVDEVTKEASYSSLFSVEEFVRNTIVSWNMNPTNVTLVDSRDMAPVYTMESFPTKLFLLTTRLPYSELTMRQVQQKVEFFCPLNIKDNQTSQCTKVVYGQSHVRPQIAESSGYLRY